MAGVPPPTWVDSGSRLTDGLDLLGLRQPVQAIGGVLLDGITSVTPNIRYLSFMCWLIYRYAAAEMPDRWSDFLKFAHRAEAALVMGNLLANQWIAGLVGPIRSQNRLASDDGMLELDPVANTPAVALYLTSAAQLHLIELRDGDVPRLVTQRGLRLAEALDESIGDLEIAKQITSATAPQRVSRGDLLALGKAIPMNQLSESERSILGDSLIPKDPLIREKSRVATYGSLLLMAQKLRRPPMGHEFLSAACMNDRFGDNRLDDWADGWLAYGIRDVLAVTHEFLCAEVIDELMYLGGEEKLPIDPKAVIRNLLSREADMKDAFIRLGVLTNFDALADLRINDLNDQVIKLTSKDRGLSNGLYRWDGPITEGAIIERALATKTGCVSLVLLAWLLVARRVPSRDACVNQQLELLSAQEDRRFGIFEIILPTIDHWLAEGADLYSVMAGLIEQTISQHLGIAWSRMQSDLSKDVALITTDEGTWRTRGKQIPAGRTISRLDQAIGWLTQLGWFDDQDGVTPAGADYMLRALRIVSEEAAA